jgi:hypothetical protein
LRGEARRRNEADSAAEFLFKARPGFDVEFFDRAERVVAEFGLVVGEMAVQLGAERVAFGGEMLDPFVHDLGVAENAKAAEEFAGDAAHVGPGGVGVDLLEDGADGTAAANGDTEIVDWVGRGIFADGIELGENAFHGFAQVALRHGERRDGDDG